MVWWSLLALKIDESAWRRPCFSPNLLKLTSDCPFYTLCLLPYKQLKIYSCSVPRASPCSWEYAAATYLGPQKPCTLCKDWQHQRDGVPGHHTWKHQKLLAHCATTRVWREFWWMFFFASDLVLFRRSRAFSASQPEILNSRRSPNSICQVMTESPAKPSLTCWFIHWSAYFLADFIRRGGDFEPNVSVLSPGHEGIFLF